MTTTRTRQCPACWSTLDLDEVECSQCGAALRRPQRMGAVLLVLVCAALATGTAWWLMRARDTPTTPDATARHQRAAKRPAPVVGVVAKEEEEQPAPTPVVFSPYFFVYGADGARPIPLLALASSGVRRNPAQRDRRHYCVPAAALPTDTGLHTKAGAPLDFTVVTWERRSAMVLLNGPEPSSKAAGFRPVEVRDAGSIKTGEVLTAVTAGGRLISGVKLQRRGTPMFFDRRLPRGSIVFDGDHRAVAYVTDHGGLPLHMLEPWRDRFDGRPLAEVQDEIRATDPRLILADARRLLQNDDVTLERAATALQKLERGQHLARDRETIDAFDRVLRFAHHQRVRLLAAIDGVRALRQAKDSLAQLGTHAGLQSDAVLLTLDHGEPWDAVQMFQALQRTGADHANKIADQVARKLHHRASVMLRDRRNQAAVSLLESVVRAFPQRANLRLLYARGLSAVGNDIAARVQAAEAVRLDGSYAAQAKRFDRVAPTSRGRTVVVIPFDPKENQIRTTGSAGGQKLGFVVDTGASYTTVPSAIARALGLLGGRNPKVRVHTASGTVEAEQIVLPWLQIAGKITVRKVTAVVLDLPGDLGGKGLLGLNVLGKLNMKIDSRRHRLVLSQDRWRRR